MLCGFVCLFCQSCQNEEIEASDNIEGIVAPVVGRLLDGGAISDVSFYCLDFPRCYTEHWLEYYAKIKTVSDYDSFRFCLMLHRDAWQYCSNDSAEMKSIYKIEYECEQERSQFIVESYNNYEGIRGWPVLFTAYLNGDLSITCDKVLFGEQPGTNLSSYFTVSSKSDCVPVGIENPQILYDFGEEIPREVPKLFVKGTWLQPDYWLDFLEPPVEKYEELTLYLSLPMIKEHLRYVAVSKYRGTEYKPRFSESVFNTKCTIRFNWK